MQVCEKKGKKERTRGQERKDKKKLRMEVWKREKRDGRQERKRGCWCENVAPDILS